MSDQLTVRNVPIEYFTEDGKVKISHEKLGRYPYPYSCAMPFSPGDHVDLVIHTASKPWTIVRAQKANPSWAAQQPSPAAPQGHDARDEIMAGSRITRLAIAKSFIESGRDIPWTSPDAALDWVEGRSTGATETSPNPSGQAPAQPSGYSEQPSTHGESPSSGAHPAFDDSIPF